MNIPVASVEYNGSEIAIIGIAGRFPGAKNIDEFWQNLQNGVESISFFTDEELLAYGLDAARLNNPKFVKARAVLEDVELFDAAFFGFNPREAEITDPQHRLFLECAYIALEDAGYDSENYQGSIGVYAGASLSRYLLNIVLNEDIIGSIDNHQLAIANDKDYLTTRVSYKLNLEGPSFTVQTACSTSLVAVHLATQSLLNGECDLALAGGVSISASRKSGYLYKEGGIGSPDGHCRAFDAQAQGTVGGEGVGIVVLKRLEDALADGDTIHAVIKGSAINNDGSFKVSYTAPRIDGQAKVIRTAQVVADVKPETITYIEAHGTGTTLGDPIEIAALTQAFRASTEKKSFCAIGSVKSNIGHLDAAAGVTGLIKTVLALKNQQIPPSLHFQEPNPQIDFANSPFYVNTKLTQWKTNGIPRRAGVSSFGIGGTNAHVILEEAPVREQGSRGAEGQGRKYHLLVLSAKTESALEKVTANLANHIQQYPELHLADVAHTLGVGRRAFDHRRMVVCQDMNDALKVLSPLDSQRVFTQYQQPVNRPVVFMFSGQGTQYVNMGRELYESEPIFTLAVDRCCELLKYHLGLDLRHILFPNEAAQVTEQLKQTSVAQPALFVIEYALAQLWIGWGVHPEAMIGHSIGEYVAATLAGVFSLEDALALVAIRGRLMQQLPSGEMLSVQLPELEIQPLLNRELSLAASNSPSYCVVSGTTEAIAQLQKQLESKAVGCRRLHISHAFHSQMMEPILQPFTEQLQKLQLHPATIPFVSNVSGTWITVAEATDPKYWVRHLRQTVRFSEGITELLKTQERIFLEVGPGRTLSTFTKQHHKDQQVILTSIRHPQEQQSDVAFLLNSLGQLWLFGVKVDWSSFYANEQRHHIPLPTYPFERQRYWIEPQKQALHSQGFVEVAAVSETKAFGEQILVAQAATSSVTNSAPTAFTITKQKAPSKQHQDLLVKKSDIADWFYIPSWKRTMPPQPQPGLGEKSGCWLVFVDECGLGEKLVKQLLLEKQDVISVRVGEQFQQIIEYSKLTYTINPQKEDEYNTLLKELRSLGKIPKRIVHLWSVTPNSYTNSAIEALGWSSLLFLAQSITENNQTDAVEISIVSNNLQEVTGSEILCPEKALVLGACKVMPLEYPNITCRSIDVVVPVESDQEEQLITTLIGELTTYTSDQIIAYRGRNRWVQDFEPVQLHETVTENLRLRKQGVYLITGGLGGVGLELAEYLAQTVQAKLILLGRSAFPDQDKWSEWLSTHDWQDRISQKIQKLQAMKALGAEVMIVSADVTNLDQMLVVLNKSNQQFGEIHGVIHAAAVYGGGMMQLTTKETVASALAPKVQGTRVLETLFQESQLDFFVLCSSLNSFVGESGMADYTAGNAFIDSFAHYSTSKYGRWKFVKSINWDRWNSVGMAIAIETRHQEITGEKLTARMVSFEGIEAFRRILCSSIPQVIVSTQDFSSRIKAKESPKSFEEKLAQLSKSKPTHPRPNLTNVYVAPSNEIERTLADVWQQLLGIEKVGTHDNFFELGGDSLFATQLVSQLCKIFQIELSYKGFFNGPTIVELAETIVQKLSEQTNLEELAQALADIEQLSEHEMQTLIASQN